jgi:hypothetical protein
MRVRPVTLVRAAIAVVAAGVLLTGCAGDSGGDEPTPSPSSPATPSPSLPPPVLPTLPGSPPVPSLSPPSTGRSGELTLTGELVSGVEAGCLLLETDAGQYLLFGEAAQELSAGATVTITGRVRTDMMSTCQQGTPFEVTEVLR